MKQSQINRTNYRVAKLDQTTAQMLYATTRNNKGDSYKLTKRARKELLEANAKFFAEKAKRMLTLLPKAKGKRKEKIIEEIKNAEFAYNQTQEQRGI